MIIEDLTNKDLQHICAALAKENPSNRKTLLEYKVEGQWIEQKYGHKEGTHYKKSGPDNTGYKLKKKLKSHSNWICKNRPDHYYWRVADFDKAADLMSVALNRINNLESKLRESEMKRLAMYDTELESQTNSGGQP